MMWGDGNENGYHDRWQMMDGGGYAFAWLLLVLVVLAVVVATVAIVMALRHSPDRPGSVNEPTLPPESGAMRALDERFARGEIDEDEYRRRRGVLNGM